MMDETYRIEPEKVLGRFSREELRHIAVSIIVLSIAFTILYRNRVWIVDYFIRVSGSENMAFVMLFLMCTVLVVISFLFHELGHKFMAQKFGLWSEFRMFNMGLVLTLVSSLIGFLFAAPGAVMISGYIDKKMNGLISIAGPAVNIIFSAIGILGCLLLNGSPAIIFFFLLGTLNASLALFNLLPIPPLDGSKIIKWNPLIWILTIAMAGSEFLFIQFMVTDLYYIF